MWMNVCAIYGCLRFLFNKETIQYCDLFAPLSNNLDRKIAQVQMRNLISFQYFSLFQNHSTIWEGLGGSKVNQNNLFEKFLLFFYVCVLLNYECEFKTIVDK